MYKLSQPSPLRRLLRRLFNVFSSVTISNRYFLLHRTESETAQDCTCDTKSSSTGTRPTLFEALSLQASQAAAFLRDQNGMLSIFRRSTFKELAGVKILQVATFHYGGPSPWDVLSWGSDPVLSTTFGVHVQYANFEDGDKEKATPLLPAPSTAPFQSQQRPSLDERDSSSSPIPKSPSTRRGTRLSESITTINALMLNPALFDPVRKPRNPIVLCHGLYGYDVWGPSSFPKLQFHYWANVLKVLKEKIGAQVLVTGVPSTGSIEERANKMDDYLSETAKGQGVNFVAHSMGGLDCRYLITHVKPKAYCPSSLVTICTPHRGSPFMDWCKSNLGLGRFRQKAETETGKNAADPDASSKLFVNLPSSFTTLLLSILDSPAYACLTTHYLENVFNPTTPDDPRVRYYSVAARIANMSIWHPLFLPKVVLDGAEERMRATERERSGEIASENDWGNDGLVTVRSARWGKFLGTLEDVDHWNVRGARGLVGGDNGEWSFDLSAVRNSLSDPFAHVGTNWKDLSRLLSWRSAEQRKNSKHDESRLDEMKSASSSSVVAEELREREAVLRSSTERFSAVFDWIAEQVPYARYNSASSSDASNPSSSSSSPSISPIVAAASPSHEKGRTNSSKDKSDLSRTFDVERFYTALTRKLYDDGL